jgi:CRISPR-associated endonuclease/helicase Cas3
VPPASPLPGLIGKGVSTTVELASLPDFEPDRPETFTRYFNLFYAKLNDTGKQFHELLAKDVNPDMNIQFRTAAERFHLIDDRAQRGVFVRYGEGETLIEELRRSGPRRELMRRLQRYTVNLHERMAAQLLQCGTLEEPWPGLLSQADWTLYDDTVGLDIYRDGIKAEDLCI